MKRFKNLGIEKEASNFVKDFKAFIMRGNVLDMAVGIIMGGAFGKIVSSLVSDIVMPLVGVLLGGVNFSELKFTLYQAVTDAQGAVIEPEVSLNYGSFIQVTVDFIIISFAIFMMIKMIGKLQRKKEEASAVPAAPSDEVRLLTQIRDLLEKKGEE